MADDNKQFQLIIYHLRHLVMVTFIFVLICNSTSIAQSNSSADIENNSFKSSSNQSYAGIERAEYRANFSAGDLVDGTFEWDLLHRGDGIAEVEITESNFAMNDLESSDQEIDWGTTQNGRRIVLVSPQTSVIRGNWSLHGRRYPGRTVYDCRLPPSLNSKLILQASEDIDIQSSVGIVREQKENSTENFRTWVIELGRHRTTALSLIKKRDINRETIPKVDVEAVYVARQDGFFVQTDFVIEGLEARNQQELEIQATKSLNVQSVTSNGVPLTYHETNRGGKSLRIDLPDTVSGSRVNLRVQGFQPARWVRPHRLPMQKLTDAIEIKRIASLRVESPLELHNVKSVGFFQSGLSEEPRGEVWKFESFQENPQLTVDLGQQKTSLEADIHSLHYLDTPTPWVISKVTKSVKNGRIFEADFELPDQWTVVSVHSMNQESEISSWSVEQQRLNVVYKKPLSSDSAKSIEILARTQIPDLSVASTFPILRVLDSSTTSIQSDWILPPDRDIDLSSEPRWSLLTSEINFDSFRHKFPVEKSVSQRVHKSYFNSSVNFESLPTFRYFTLTEVENESLENGEPDVDPLTTPSTIENTASSLSADVTLLTQAESLGDMKSPRLVHHASISFSGETSPGRLGLKLSENCLLSSVTVDDQVVTVLREGQRIIFPEDVLTFKTLTLIYITESTRTLLNENCQIPLPLIEFPTNQFHWLLEIPNERKLSHVIIPGFEFPESQHHFFFGSLSANRFLSNLSESSKNIFQSNEYFTDQLNPEENVRRYQFHTLNSVEHVYFRAWNFVQSTNIGWVAFFACMIIGVGGRLLGSKVIQILSPWWLITLFIAQLLLTNGLSMILGSMLAGTLISILLPVEFLRLPEVKTVPKTTGKLATASLVMGVLLTTFGFAQELRLSGNLSQKNLKRYRYLLRSAVYEVDHSNSNTYLATLEVLTLRSVTETLVELPYQGIVFPAGAECLVDSQKQTLIPAVSGKGVVIRVPASNEQPPVPKSPWEKHTIQFRFSLRETSSSSAHFEDSVRLPVIQETSLLLNENLLISPEFEADSFARQGQIDHFPTGQIKIAIGPVPSFSPRRPISDEIPSQNTIYTFLNISAARMAGQLFLSPEVKNRQDHLILRVPDSATITNVSGTGILRWFLSEDLQQQEILIIEYQPDISSRETTVTFHMPSFVNTKNEVVLPDFPWVENDVKHLLGIRSPNGVSISTTDTQNQVKILPTDAWSQNEHFGRVRPQLVLELANTQNIRLSLQELNSVVTGKISESITIDRSKMDWQADLDIEVTEMPLFVMSFQLKGGLRISSVRPQGSGNLPQLRYIQNGDHLSVFIPGGQLGSRKLTLNGDVPFSPQTLRSLPGIDSIPGEPTKSTLRLYDQTNWQIELAGNDGATIEIGPLKSENVISKRLIGEYSTEAADRPTKIRLLPPPSATRVDIATRIHINDNQGWNCVQLLHFSGNQTPLKKLTFSVPKSLQNVRIGPRYFRTEQKVLEKRTEYTIPIPERFSDEVTIQVYSKIPADFVNSLLNPENSTLTPEIPGVKISSARTVSQFLFFNYNSFVTVPPSEAIPVERKNLPRWIPLQWQEAVNNLQIESYQITDGQPSLTLQNHAGSEDEPLLHFAESLMWIPKAHKVMGMTRLWLTGADRFIYELPFRDSIQISRAVLPSQGDLEFITSNSERAVQVQKLDAATPIIVYWESSQQQDQKLFSPLDSEMTGEIRQCIGLISGQNSPHRITHQDGLDQTDALIYRWKAMLEIAETLQVPLEIDSLFYNELIESNVTMTNLLKQNNLSVEQRTAIENSMSQWEIISEGLTVIAGPVLKKKEIPNPSFEPLVTQRNQFQSVNWALPNSENKILIDLQPAQALPWWTFNAVKAAVVLILFVLLYQYQTQFKRLIRAIRPNPVIRLLLLGGIWMLFFQPILIGFILISLAFVVQLSRKKEVQVEDPMTT